MTIELQTYFYGYDVAPPPPPTRELHLTVVMGRGMQYSTTEYRLQGPTTIRQSNTFMLVPHLLLETIYFLLL